MWITAYWIIFIYFNSLVFLRLISFFVVVVVVLQSLEHPNPGQPYTCRGFPRFCFLPDNDKGRKVSQQNHETPAVSFDHCVAFSIRLLLFVLKQLFETPYNTDVNSYFHVGPGNVDISAFVSVLFITQTVFLY